MSRGLESLFLQARRVALILEQESSVEAVIEPPGFVTWLEQHKVKLWPYQRVWALVSLDNIDPIDLPSKKERKIARELFGPVERFPESAKSVVTMTKGRRQGGTWMCSLFLLYAAEFQDLNPPNLPMLEREQDDDDAQPDSDEETPDDGVALGEIAFCPLVAPDKETAKQSLNFIAGFARAHLKERITTDTTELLIITRRDGKPVGIKVFAASKGGKAARGRTMPSAMMDEAAFFYDQATGAINDVDIFDSMQPAVLPGPCGKILLLSTVWAETGLLHDKMGQAGWTLGIGDGGERAWRYNDTGEEPTSVAALCPTLKMRPNSKLLQVYATMMRTEPENARREFDCIPFKTGESQFFPTEWIYAAAQMVMPANSATVTGTGADFGFEHDSAAISTVKRTHEDSYFQVSLEELIPGEKPLVPSVTIAHFANVAKTHGDDTIAADGHYRQTVDEELRKAGVALFSTPGGTLVSSLYVLARSLLADGRIGIMNHPKFIEQMKNAKRVVRAGGLIYIDHPRKPGSGHGDLVVAWVNAVWRANQLGLPDKPVVFEDKDAKWEHDEWQAIEEAEEEERIRAEIENRY